MQPFEEIKVIDLTHVLAGPFSTYQLAVHGADVIKVEHPRRPDQVRETGADPELGREYMGTNFLTQSSNKRSITLDLETEKGRAILLRLVADADVFAESYRTGALDNLGLGYDDLRAINPNLIYCSLTGFGRTGPKAAHTAYDGVIQAASGLMSVSGTPETTPLKVGAPIVDYASGISAAFAITAALLQRERAGGGSQHIDISMMDVALTLLSSTVCGYLTTGKVIAQPRGNSFSTPNGSCFATRDGLLMISALNARQHRRLWIAVGRPEFAEKHSPEEIAAHDGEMRLALAEAFMTRTAQEWEDILNGSRVPAARVRTVPEALDMPQLKSRGNLMHEHGYVESVGRALTVPVTAFGLAHGGPVVSSPPPLLGEHTSSVLTELGFSGAEIVELRDEGVI